MGRPFQTFTEEQLVDVLHEVLAESARRLKESGCSVEQTIGGVLAQVVADLAFDFTDPLVREVVVELFTKDEFWARKVPAPVGGLKTRRSN